MLKIRREHAIYLKLRKKVILLQAEQIQKITIICTQNGEVNLSQISQFVVCSACSSFLKYRLSYIETYFMNRL